MTGIAMFISEARKLIESAAHACWAITDEFFIPVGLAVFSVFRHALHAASDFAAERYPSLPRQPVLVILGIVGTVLVAGCAAIALAVFAAVVAVLVLLWLAPVFVGLKLVATALVVGVFLSTGVLVADELEERLGVAVSLDDVLRRRS